MVGRSDHIVGILYFMSGEVVLNRNIDVRLFVPRHEKVPPEQMVRVRRCFSQQSVPESNRTDNDGTKLQEKQDSPKPIVCACRILGTASNRGNRTFSVDAVLVLLLFQQTISSIGSLPAIVMFALVSPLSSVFFASLHEGIVVGLHLKQGGGGNVSVMVPKHGGHFRIFLNRTGHPQR